MKVKKNENYNIIDDEMLKKWLSNKEEKAFENGIKYASEKIFNLCNAMSMPVCLSIGDDSLYVSVEEIKNIIKDIQSLN